MILTRPITAFCALLLTMALTGCGDAEVEKLDLSSLRSTGELRILAPRLGGVAKLPRHGHTLGFELELAEDFARSEGLEPVVVWVDRRDDLIPELVRGRGDLIAANLTVTTAREARIAFSDPLTFVTEQVVSRVEQRPLRGPADLAGRTVVVRRSSTFWNTIEALRADLPEIELIAAPEDMDTEEILYRVATGEFDVSIADDILVEEVLAYTPQLYLAFDLSARRPLAWGLRKGATELRLAVNRFIEESNLAANRPERYSEDLPGIRDRNVLRVLTRNNASTYFIWRGELMGFEHDLAKRFAERLGLHLQVIVAPTRAALLSWLQEGRGDLVAAGLTITEEREARGIAFSLPYNFVRETLVGRAADSAALQDPSDLAGRTVAVRRSSSYWETVARLQANGIDLQLEAAPEELETEEIINRVANGEYDLTVVDSHILDIELAWRDDIYPAFSLSDSMAHGWAVREEHAALKAAIDEFMEQERRGVFYNVTYRKYFRSPRRISRQASGRAGRSGAISPYDDLIREYAAQYEFDWRLIAAQMYQESRFNPEARSFAGAVGLMQVLPRTGRELGIASLDDPASSVEAGVRYLHQMHGRVEGEISEEDRLWFSLAAYNAGHGHVHDARRLAESLGRNPNVWFGEVEAVMPLLARSEYHRRARFGYCRCSEPVNYVRQIRERYRAYSDVVAAAWSRRTRLPRASPLRDRVSSSWSRLPGSEAAPRRSVDRSTGRSGSRAGRTSLR